MFQDGCRGVDLIRWKKYETLKTADHEVWNLTDDMLTGGSKHKAVIKLDAQSSIYKDAGAGFKEGKNELLPFPQRAVDLNSALKQNPGW